MATNFFETLLILLSVSIFVSVIFRKLNIPLIVGYILVGVILGPFGVSLVTNNKTILDVAEFGIVFLMFTIGLEFSFGKLLKMKTSVLGFGSLEVLLAIAITTLVGIGLTMNVSEAFVIGCIVAMSSTAIVVKQLSDQIETHSPHGRHAIGILLFQDLAVIPILIVIPELADTGAHQLSANLVEAVLKGLGAVVVISLLGRYALRPMFFWIAKMRSLEIFSITTLLITLASAWLTHRVGLSFTLGAFLAGMMLGETEFRHQIETDIRPFRDVLLALFFITIGMQFNTDILVEAWPWILTLCFALVVFKFGLIWGLGRLLRIRQATAFKTAVVLAHGGEFGFAILSLAMIYNILPADYAQVTLGALVISMTLAPFMVRYNHKLCQWVTPKAVKHAQAGTEEEVKNLAEELHQHVILCGYGRVGQNIARFLDKATIPYIAFDLDPVRVRQVREAGEKVAFADVTHFDVLSLARIHQAKAVVISFYNPDATVKIIEQIRIHNKRIPIIARAHDDVEANQLFKQGATEVIPEVLEGSLMLASHILMFMGVSGAQVNHWMHESRANRYDMLRMVFPGQESLSLDPFEDIKSELILVELDDKAKSVGHSLSDLHFLNELEVKISAIRRQDRRLIDPPPHTKLEAGDVVVLFGQYPNLEQAQTKLLRG